MHCKTNAIWFRLAMQLTELRKIVMVLEISEYYIWFQRYVIVILTGLQPKTFKTFILMVKPLKPLFFSEKNFI